MVRPAILLHSLRPQGTAALHCGAVFNVLAVQHGGNGERGGSPWASRSAPGYRPKLDEVTEFVGVPYALPPALRAFHHWRRSVAALALRRHTGVPCACGQRPAVTSTAEGPRFAGNSGRYSSALSALVVTAVVCGYATASYMQPDGIDVTQMPVLNPYDVSQFVPGLNLNGNARNRASTIPRLAALKRACRRRRVPPTRIRPKHVQRKPCGIVLAV